MTGHGDSDRHTDFFAGAAVPVPPIPDDDGLASPQLRQALGELARGRGAGSSVLHALSTARLFVPVVAVLEESDVGSDGLRHEKTSSMATVLVDSAGHGRAQLAFSSIAALSAWNGAARPVALMAPLAARSAVSDSVSALLVDIAGPVPFALTGQELLLMAALSASPDAASDPVLLTALTEAVRRAAAAPRLALDLAVVHPDDPAELTVAGVEHATDRAAVVREISRDRVVEQLLPHGLRVTFSDTP